MFTPEELQAKTGPYIGPDLIRIFQQALEDIERKMEFLFKRDGMSALRDMDAMLDERTAVIVASDKLDPNGFYMNVALGVRDDFLWWITNEMKQAGWIIHIRPKTLAEAGPNERLMMADKVNMYMSIRPRSELRVAS